uniref:Uncharacterized protein n=1 Tax=Anopheles culicifacies TaxID=139723 RepID=A0A182MU10_9DIPT
MKSIIALVLFVACATQVYSGCLRTYPYYSHHVSTLDELHGSGCHRAGYHHGILNCNHPSVSSYHRPGPCSCGNCVRCKSHPSYPYYSGAVVPFHQYGSEAKFY